MTERRRSSARPGVKQLRIRMYFSDSVLEELQREADRLDRSFSWLLQKAWELSRERMRGDKQQGVDLTPIRRDQARSRHAAADDHELE